MDNISYTPEEVAQILKISRFTVYEMIKRGDLSAYRIGRKVRVEHHDLEHYKQTSKGGGPFLVQSTVKIPEPLAVTQNGLIICGQDVVLDILTRHLETLLPHHRFLRRHTGSIDGLLALYRGSANLAATHLWDSDHDEYNIPYARRLLPGQKTVIYNLVHRMAGFFVKTGNPKKIHTWADLTQPNIQLINRECGSGARVLLDEKLRFHSLDSAQISGYSSEVTSHLAVASRIARGEADVGIGIEKVAVQVPEIEFVPLQKERYDLVMRKEDLNLPHFQQMLQLLRSAAFQNELQGISGYDLSQTGHLVAEV